MGLARQASRLPLTALSIGLEAWERSAGVRQFAWRRAGEALQIAAHTPLGRLLPTVGADEHPEEGSTPTATADPTARPAPRPTPQPTRVSAAEPAAVTEAEPVRAARASAAAREVGAPGAVTAEVEELVDQLAIPEPETRTELPIPDFDNITLGSLRARLRNLSLEQLVTLREWEQAHAHRLPVLTTLDNRIAKLAAIEAYPDGQEAPARLQ